MSVVGLNFNNISTSTMKLITNINIFLHKLKLRIYYDNFIMGPNESSSLKLGYKGSFMNLKIILDTWKRNKPKAELKFCLELNCFTGTRRHQLSENLDLKLEIYLYSCILRIHLLMDASKIDIIFINAWKLKSVKNRNISLALHWLQAQ